MTFGVADHELNSCALISQRAFLHFIHSDVVALQYSERFIWQGKVDALIRRGGR